MPFWLTPNLKIIKAVDYQAVFKHGKITKGRYWKIVARKTNTKPRLGLAISNKVHKLAVERNRYKRMAREVFRIHQDELNNWEFVVMAKQKKYEKSDNNKTIAQDLLDLFRKITNH